MAAILQGKGYVFGTSAAGVVGSYLGYLTSTDGSSAMTAGYVATKIPVAEGASLSHNAEVERVQDTDGDYTGLIITAEYVECTFDMRPEGSSVANALGAATIPPVGATFVITNLPIIAAGSFADVLNVDTGGSAPETHRWVYEGGGSLRLSNTGKAMVTLPLRRYPGIAPAGNVT